MGQVGLRANAETVRINKVLGYGPEEIAANRQGQMTNKQVAALRKDLVQTAVIFGGQLVVALILLVLMLSGRFMPLVEELFSYSTASRMMRFIVIGYIALAFWMVFCLVALFNVIKGMFAMDGGKVLRYEGPVRTERISQRGITNHFLHFHGLKRDVPPEIFALFQNGRQYVIYHLEGFPSILSVEAIDPVFNT